MPELNLFELPLSYPPDGYGWDERSMSELSTTTAFRTGLDRTLHRLRFSFEKRFTVLSYHHAIRGRCGK